MLSLCCYFVVCGVADDMLSLCCCYFVVCGVADDSFAQGPGRAPSAPADDFSYLPDPPLFKSPRRALSFMNNTMLDVSFSHFSPPSPLCITVVHLNTYAGQPIS